MNPNSRQVYTGISSADKLCISHTESILLFFKEWGRGGEGEWVCHGVGGLDMIWSKILPEAKSVSSQCTTVVFFFLFVCLFVFFPFSFFPKNRGEEKCAKVPCSHFHIPTG